MKTGLTLDELQGVVTAQKHSAKDFIVQTLQMEYLHQGGKDQLVFPVRGGGELYTGIRPLAREQLADYLAIPRDFFRRVHGAGNSLYTEDSGSGERVALIESVVNALLANKGQEQRMVRTLDGSSRALLSDRYKCLDNYGVLEHILPVLAQIPDVRFESMDLTDSRLYVKAVTPKLTADVKVGDTVQMGLCITNSEVGKGSLSVQPLLYRLSCLNGAVYNTLGAKAIHSGVKFDYFERKNYEIVSRDTLRKEIAATFGRIRDYVAHGLETVFRQIVEQARGAAERKVEGDPIGAVEATASLFDLGVEEKTGMIGHFLREADYSQWGLMNAITHTAQEVDSYDRSHELEIIGPKVLSVTPEQWRSIAHAKAPKIGRN